MAAAKKLIVTSPILYKGKTLNVGDAFPGDIKEAEKQEVAHCVQAPVKDTAPADGE